jgi:hypothetical protein
MMTDPFDTNSTARPPLSPEGRARREAMLVELQRAVAGAARRRRAARAAAIIAPPAIALAFVFTYLSSTGAPARPPIADNTPSGNLPDDTTPAPIAPGDAAPVYRMAHANFEIISVPPTAQVITNPTSRARTISDDELLELLQRAGHDVGLIRAGSRVILTDNRSKRPAEPSSQRHPSDEPGGPVPAA